MEAVKRYLRLNDINNEQFVIIADYDGEQYHNYRVENLYGAEATSFLRVYLKDRGLCLECVADYLFTRAVRNLI